MDGMSGTKLAVIDHPQLWIVMHGWPWKQVSAVLNPNRSEGGFISAQDFFSIAFDESLPTTFNSLGASTNEVEEEEQMKIVKMVQDSYISTRTQPTQSVISELGRAMSWSAQGTKKKDKNYMALFFSENSAKNSKSFDPAKESKSWSEQTTTTHQSPIATSSSPTHCTTNTTTTTTATTTSSTDKTSTPAVCGGDCGNIMCSLSPACIEDMFEDTSKKAALPCSSPSGPPSDEVSDDGSLRRRTKSEGCYSTAYRCKSSKKSVSAYYLISYLGCSF
ncbi:uncharacterized protein CEXT_95231 [Caerostris extrusa]|uniref:Uncharacterized protein n=1 Tax=Caerostris extrusa TaxID=172846 RepID=A0AAV4PCM9_CAEEX|nr:uncharacterized protein CEXT_95231 [Caerostris extrusa]